MGSGTVLDSWSEGFLTSKVMDEVVEYQAANGGKLPTKLFLPKKECDALRDRFGRYFQVWISPQIITPDFTKENPFEDMKEQRCVTCTLEIMCDYKLRVGT